MATLSGPKERHRRAHRCKEKPPAPASRALIAKPTVPKSKYPSYFEFVENKEKKKRLDFQVEGASCPEPLP